jgi:hypothetical protein
MIAGLIKLLVAQWLRHYAASRKTVVSGPDEIVDSCNLPNPSGRTRLLGFPQPLTQLSTRSRKILFREQSPTIAKG